VYLIIELLAGTILVMLALGGIAPYLIVMGASQRVVMALTVAMIAATFAAIMYIDARKKRRKKPRES
jgi:uncharacterized membrane protein (UPF0136 family)